MAKRCILKCLKDLHAPIVLSNGQNCIIGRSRETKIKDKRCSKNQVELLADYSTYTVTVRQIGANTSGVNGKPLHFGNTSVLKHRDILEVLLGQYQHIIEFEPPPVSSVLKSERLSGEDMPRRAGTKRNSEDNMGDSSKKARGNGAVGANGWESLYDDSLLVLNRDMEGSSKVAGYDMDGTLITTKSGRVFAVNTDDWKIIFPEVPGKLKQLHKEGYKLIIFTNQAGIASGKSTASDIQKKISNIISTLGVPMQALVSTGKGPYRKPATGMWEFLKKEANGGIEIDVQNSMYVGDAAGRPAEGKKKKDFSSGDRLFALNIGIPFFTPEEHFLGVKTQKFNMPEFDPRTVSDSVSLFDPPSTKVPKHELEVIVFVGYPGSGKSFLASTHFAAAGYVQANRDTVGSWQKCISIMEKSLQEGKNVVIDNTNPDVESRQRYILAAKKLKVPVRCFVFNVSKDHCRHNNKYRTFSGANHESISDMVYNMYKSKYVEPTLKEGFDDIVKVNFVPSFRTTKDEEMYKMFLLEK
ncbi:uncharacterized protein F21D5.5-like isoform X1 [Macrobrachium nipponense]|uniref:uncharacterized protein F21D5.5-like isoform X1 n=2 Tax=Macrobrachium nipponense TaxID=159736 RepID=UPI0030C85EB1